MVYYVPRSEGVRLVNLGVYALVLKGVRLQNWGVRGRAFLYYR